MANTDQKKHDKRSIDPLTAGVTGAVIGAGAVAMGVVLKNKKNREKLKGAITGVKDKTLGYMEDIHNSANDLKENIKDNLEKK
jgi:gas vesicle protein